MSIGFFTRNRPGVLISRITNDVDALDQLISTGVVTLSSTLTLVGVVVILLAARRTAGAGRVPHLPAAGGREHRLPDRRGERLPDHARADRRGDRLPAGEPERDPGGAELRPGAAAREPDGRAQRAQPPGEPEDRLPQRLLLPGGRAALGDRHGGDPALRRLPGARPHGNAQARADRRRGRLRRLPERRSSTRSSSSRSSTRPTSRGWRRSTRSSTCSTPSPTWSTSPDAIDPRPLRGEIEMDDVWFSYGRDKVAGVKRSRAGKLTAEEDAVGHDGGDDWAMRDVSIHCPPARRWRWSARPAPASRPSRSWSRASTTPSAAGSWSTATTCATCRRSCLRSQLGIVPQEGFLFSGSVRRQHRLRPPGRLAMRRSRRRPTRSAPTSSSGASRRVTRPRSASAASRSPPGQRQLIAFARALLAEPRILILDEATSNVDVRTERTIEAGLERLLAGPHRDRDRPPALDHPPRRPDRRARERRRSPRSAPTTS